MTIIDEFSYHLVKEGRKQSTIETYRDIFTRLLKNASPLNVDTINEYLYSLVQSGRKATYINHYVDLLRLYGRFKDIPEFQNIEYFKEKEHIKATMSDDEIEAFLSLPIPSNRGVNKVNYGRWTLFFSICAYTGMRMGEVANLTIDDVDFGRGIFIVKDTKTNTPRYVPIPQNIIETLRDYIKILQTSKLFPSRNGGTHRSNGVVDSVDWGYNFATRIERLGIKRSNLSCYSLRHSFITRLLDEDVNIFKVQKIVGHRQIATTAHYTHLTIKDIQQAITKHPLIRKSTNPKDIMTALITIVKGFDLGADKRFSFHFEEREDSVSISVAINKF